MKMRHIFLVLLLFPFLAQATERGGGDEGPHGGDEVALEFLQAFSSAVGVTKLAAPELYQKIQSAGLPLLPKLENIIVVEVPLPVQKDGYTQESVATNDPATGMIVINRARWEKIKNLRLREAVALHEVASLKRLENTGSYTISGAYISLFGISEENLESAAYYPPPPPPPAREGTLSCAPGNGEARTYLSEKSSYSVTEAICETLVPDHSERCSKPQPPGFGRAIEEVLENLNKEFHKRGFKKITLNELRDSKAQTAEACTGWAGLRNRYPANTNCLLFTVQRIYRHRVCGMPW
jgi:hypothetical protein